ncbi:MAG: CoA pyrophosphatase [Caldilinea sp.]
MCDIFEPFLRQLRQDLRGALPGRSVQYQMAPRPRPGGEFEDTARSDARQGGVLVLLYPHEEQIFLALILRPNYPGVHGGQIGLPGGGQEPSDTDLTATALRETYEEIGVHASQYSVLGQLTSLYVSASNYVVQPAVAWIDYRPEFHPDPYEVAVMIEAPLLTLLDPATRRVEPWTLRGQQIDVPFFALEGYAIWGATAMMLSELLALPAMRVAPGMAPRAA